MPDAHTAKRVSGGWPGRLSRRHAPSDAAASALATPERDRLVRGAHALGGDHRADEVLEHDRVAVGDEVDAARGRLGRAQPQPLDGVVDVGDGGQVGAAADPAELARVDELDQDRQQRGIALAPHEARSDDHGLEAVVVGGAHGQLGPGLGGRVQRRRVGSQRRVLVDVDQRLPGHQRRLGAHVHDPTRAGVAGGREHVLGAVDVDALELLGLAPVLGLGRGVEDGLDPVGALAQGRQIVEVAGHRLGPAVAHGRGRALRARQRAHVPALGAQPLDQAAADEARSPGDECGGHDRREPSAASRPPTRRCRSRRSRSADRPDRRASRTRSGRAGRSRRRTARSRWTGSGRSTPPTCRA